MMKQTNLHSIRLLSLAIFAAITIVVGTAFVCRAAEFWRSAAGLMEIYYERATSNHVAYLRTRSLAAVASSG